MAPFFHSLSRFHWGHGRIPCSPSTEQWFRRTARLRGMCVHRAQVPVPSPIPTYYAAAHDYPTASRSRLWPRAMRYQGGVFTSAAKTTRACLWIYWGEPLLHSVAHSRRIRKQGGAHVVHTPQIVAHRERIPWQYHPRSNASHAVTIFRM